MESSSKASKSGSKRSFDVAFLAGSSKDDVEGSREKSAFTKYKDKNEDQPNVQSNPSTNLNMMHFPALRKLLDITGGGHGSSSGNSGMQSFKVPNTLTIPSLTLPPSPTESLGSMLPPSLALGLNPSNTCAKCGVTFRMTSDLVYHMRTHHSKSNQMR